MGTRALGMICLLVVVGALLTPARGAEPSVECPPGKSCKIIVLTSEEEGTLVGPEMLFDFAVWANRAKFTDLVAAWREKLRQAPAGKVQPEKADANANPTKPTEKK